MLLILVLSSKRRRQTTANELSPIQPSFGPRPTAWNASMTVHFLYYSIRHQNK